MAIDTTRAEMGTLHDENVILKRRVEELEHALYLHLGRLVREQESISETLYGGTNYGKTTR